MATTQSQYNDTQSNEIIRTAVRLAARDDITFDELVAAGKELGISREELETAEETRRQNESEEGQRAEFRRMQNHEFRLTVFNTCLLVGIVLLIIFIDIREIFVAALLAGWVGGGAFLYFRYSHIHNESLLEHRDKFEEWKRMKDIWLRPERAKEIVDEIFEKEIRLPFYASATERKLRVIGRLRDRLGYDRRRADAVFEAYLREHPEADEVFLR